STCRFVLRPASLAQDQPLCESCVSARAAPATASSRPTRMALIAVSWSSQGFAPVNQARATASPSASATILQASCAKRRRFEASSPGSGPSCLVHSRAVMASDAPASAATSVAPSEPLSRRTISRTSLSRASSTVLEGSPLSRAVPSGPTSDAPISSSLPISRVREAYSAACRRRGRENFHYSFEVLLREGRVPPHYGPTGSDGDFEFERMPLGRIGGEVVMNAAADLGAEYVEYARRELSAYDRVSAAR